jgi:uncharacterized protein (DUF1015 family)
VVATTRHAPYDPAMSADGPPVPDGLVLRPFRALRFAAPTDLASLTSPPYDVIDPDARLRLEARSPHNAVHLILPRAQGSAQGEPYATAARLLQQWQETGALVRDPEPALYVYEQQADGHTQRGLVGGVGLARAEAGIILPHEDTMAGPVADRLALLRATSTDLEPIFLVYAGAGGADAIVQRVIADTPLVDGSTDDGVRHRLWAITDPDVLADIAADLRGRRATIADGHHRYATYLRHQAEQHEAGRGRGPWDYGLAFLVDASSSGPQVHAIHRLVPSLPFDEARDRAARGFTIRELEEDLSPPAALSALADAGRAGPAFAITDGHRTVLLTDPDARLLKETLPADRSDAWRGLDVAVAHTVLVRRLWELDDREGVVDFVHDAESALRAAREGGGTALLLNPTPVESVAAVAEAGDRMPRKSTLFTPKPATGMLFRPLDG